MCIGKDVCVGICFWFVCFINLVSRSLFVVDEIQIKAEEIDQESLLDYTYINYYVYEINHSPLNQKQFKYLVCKKTHLT